METEMDSVFPETGRRHAESLGALMSSPSRLFSPSRERFEPNFRGPWPSCGTRFPIRHGAFIHNNPDTVWPKQSEIIDLGRRLIGGALCGLVGPRGTGKTLIAAWLARELGLHGYMSHAFYFTGSDLFGLMKSWYSVPSSDAGHNNRLLSDVPLLIIDEMQERVESEHEDKMLTHLIDKRYGLMKPTLLIANLMPDAFVKHVGPSISSRIQEGGTLLVCNWPSFRSPT